MKRFCVSILVLIISAIAGGAVAAPMRSAQCAARASVAAQPAATGGIVVTPFAVPVAVPVAVISQPLVLYSYRQYAAPATGVESPPTPTPDGGAATEAPAPQPPAAAPPCAKPPSAAPSATAAPAAIVQDSVAALLTARCAKCHTGASPAGHLQLFDVAGQIMPRLPRRAIVEMVSPDEAGKQRMPPGDLPKLSADELAALRQWAQPPRDLAY